MIKWLKEYWSIIVLVLVLAGMIVGFSFLGIRESNRKNSRSQCYADCLRAGMYDSKYEDDVCLCIERYVPIEELIERVEDE